MSLTEVTNPGHHRQGKHRGEQIPKYTAEDIRFTQKDGTLYAICLQWPADELRIRTLGHQGKFYPGDILSVKLLGSDEKLVWARTPDALIVPVKS